MEIVPQLDRIARASSSKSRREQVLKRVEADVLCRCLDWSRKHLKRDSFCKKGLNKISRDEEGLRFLARLSRCSSSKIDGKKRTKTILQVSQGISQLLKVLLPKLEDLINDRVFQGKLKKEK